MVTHSSILAWRIPMDRGTWLAIVCRVAKSWTWLCDQAHMSCLLKHSIFLKRNTHIIVAYTMYFKYCYCCCSVTKLCPTFCDPMDCSTPGFPEFAQTHVHWTDDAIQSSYPLSPSPAHNLSEHQGIFQWVGSSHQVAKLLELQHQSLQWIFNIDFF